MAHTRIQPAAERPAPRVVAEADEQAARLLVAQRGLIALCRQQMTEIGRANARRMIARNRAEMES